MKPFKAMRWGTIGLLLSGLILMAGCGGGDDEGEGGTSTIVVTNSAGETTVIVVTNVPPPADLVVASVPMVAPQQIAPENGKEFSVVLADMAVPIDFQWTAVPGATSYIVNIYDKEYPAASTQVTIKLINADYTWQVRAVNSVGKGPQSEESNFLIRVKPLDFQPLEL